jgi:3',5'-nucleoside bisphosphate phosphatase
VRIDLHTHSTASDGTQTPAELIRAAAEVLDVVAITDHDTSEGWDEASVTAAEVGITLVRGMEISTRCEGQGVHLLAYLPDPGYPPLVAALQKILDGRNSRVPLILAKLADLGFAIDIHDVRAAAGDTAAYGRPHIADALVARGFFPSRDEVFAELLNTGRPAYVDRYAAPLEEMIELVTAAGGATVIAHPWGRRSPGAMGEQGLARLAGLGLAGLEVDHQDHSPAIRTELRRIARDLDLVVTGSSDHHGTGKKNHELGVNTTAPAEFERLLDRAAASARAAGRVSPTVLVP